ncbi:integrase core domain-containing protein [Paenibacillus sp. GCM10027629]|uniref:integrase core domain-containing protein n=1 Tax=Paenibacillus sp. GCM10027629 TaxID=3273414 RepID=UPI00362C4F9C
MACLNFGVKHDRIPPRTPNMNAHIESFHRLLQDECLSRYDFQNYSEANDVFTSNIDYYNERRIHSSIGDRSPRNSRITKW